MTMISHMSLRVQGVILVCHQLVGVQQCVHIRPARCVVCWQGYVNIPLMLFQGLGKECHILQATAEALPENGRHSYGQRPPPGQPAVEL